MWNKLGENATNSALTFDHFALGIGFTCFDDFITGGEELEAMLFVSIGHISNSDVLQGDDAARFLVGRELKIVKTIVI